MPNLINLFITISVLSLLVGCQANSQPDTSVKKDTIQLSFELPEEEWDYSFATKFSDFKITDETRFIDGDKFGINLNPEDNYKILKYSIKTEREKLKQKYLSAVNQTEKDKIIEEAGNYISETLVNKIFPFWYGMPWDMAGYSEIPNDGEVGCSYFVSNTMKHCGFKVNRYRLAQQNTKNIALSVQTNDSILILDSNSDINTIKNYFLENKKEGLYYVGLDSHVGYLLYKMGEVFFIQSNYAEPVEVLIEYSEKSDVFLSNKYYISDIQHNNPLIIKWLLNKEIKVVME